MTTTRCRYCHVLIYFTGVLYRQVSNDSSFCFASPDHFHQRY